MPRLRFEVSFVLEREKLTLELTFLLLPYPIWRGALSL